MQTYRFGCLILIAAFSFACTERPSQEYRTAASIPEKIDFNFQVRPILSDRCFPCHGPDEKARKADLRLDQEEYAFAMLDSVEKTFAIIPGNRAGSQMAHRISSKDPDYMMPPPESKLSLTDYEIEVIKRWIEQGAEWKPHWAFIPPQEAKVPEVSTLDWANNAVDHFILARLEQEGLNPSPEASREKLIRRLSTVSS